MGKATNVLQAEHNVHVYPCPLKTKNNVIWNGLGQIKSLGTFTVFNRSSKIKYRHPSSWLQNFFCLTTLLVVCQEKKKNKKIQTSSWTLSWRWGLPPSEARKTKADEKMDKISPEGPRGLVELKLLKAALNRRLPTWPWASISSAPQRRRHAIVPAPGLTPGALHVGWTVAPKCWLMDGKFPPSSGEAQRTRTKHRLGWERAHGWVLSANCPFLGREWLVSFFFFSFYRKNVISFMKWSK